MSKRTISILALAAAIVAAYVSITKPTSNNFPHASQSPSVAMPEFLVWAYQQKDWYRNYAALFRRATSCAHRAETTDVSSNNLGMFYVQPGTLQCLTVNPVDDSGIPYHESGDDKTYPPTHVAYTALMYWSAAQLGEKKYLELFLRQAEWLRQRIKSGRVEWDRDLPSRGLTAPWISALTQAQTISVLLRAYQHTGKEVYLTDASAAMVWLATPVSSDGVAYSGENGIWLEEYPSKSRPSHVLNGHLTAMLGVWDYYRVTQDSRAKALFDAALSAVRAEVDRYDVGYWLVYDQTNRVDVINGTYMSWVIEHFKVLHAITGDAFFQRYATKWQYYQDNDTLFIKMAMEEHAKANAGIK